MTNFRSYPRLETFERLQIRDGLPINAERWQYAHDYHRRRQNFHYQTLYQPGIVYGLGVAVMPNQPDGRLLQIQPGIAIDIEGNPIVIKQPEEFRITSEPGDGQVLTVYLVINYVDPNELRHPPAREFVQETFRIVETLQLAPKDVELCRIRLQFGIAALQVPPNVFSPAVNQLDFRGRCDPLPYPSWWVKVGQVLSEQDHDATVFKGLVGLLQALEGLYPSLGAVPTISTIAARDLHPQAQLDCHVLYLPYGVWLRLPTPALECLQAYLADGGVVLLVADFAEVNLENQLEIAWELRSGLADAKHDADLYDQITAEIAAYQHLIAQSLAEVEQQVAIVAARLGLSLAEPGDLGANHPLRSVPFLFSQFPRCPEYPIVLKNWGGLVLMVGNLARCWHYDPTMELSREVMRSAQEWGVNLLHFAVRRSQWMQAMKPSQTDIHSLTDSLQQRLTHN